MELAVALHVPRAAVDVALSQLRARGLVRIAAQGRHGYYTLADTAGGVKQRAVLDPASTSAFVSHAPVRLRGARTCYGHAAGALGVAVHDRMLELGWLQPADVDGGDYALSAEGETALVQAGVDVPGARRRRGRFAYACLDWSERRPHLAGALGAAWLEHALRCRWVARVPDSRALDVTTAGRRALRTWLHPTVQAV
ncbi:MAG TPA: transcriptional regulator [Rhodanobacteraceae bacterium]